MAARLTPGAALPRFAVLGAVNHGKSSVVAALAENDRVRISRMPGETVENQRFELGGLFAFFDTPGFQNAREALDELRPAAQAAEPLSAFAAFIARHRDDPAFDAECRLFEPVVQGAGIVYVVDGSRPLLPLHEAEMELLRLTGAPRLALINRTGADDHGAAWKLRLAQHFNAVRDFDAHRAGFAERIELLETLAGIEQHWKGPLMQGVQRLREDWQRRLDEAAGHITTLLVEALQHAERDTAAPAEAAAREAALARLRERFHRSLATREAACHAALIDLFAHRLVTSGELPAALVGDDLFADSTWALLGLDAKQLLAAGAVAGAAVGAGADLLTAGHTLLAGSALGAAVGAAGALALGKQRPELGVGGGPGGLLRWRLGGSTLQVGPYAALNFPWVLIDRAMGTLAHLMQRSHARRDAATLTPEALQAVLAAQGLGSTAWPSGPRKTCDRVFARIRRGRHEPADLQALRGVLRAQLDALATSRREGEP